MATDHVIENGLSVDLKENYDNPSRSKTFYNTKMKISRELVLASLGSYLEEASIASPIKCLDSFAATGIAGLQWKHHYGAKVLVTINDLSKEATTSIKETCDKNNFIVALEKLSSHVNQDGLTCDSDVTKDIDPAHVRVVEVTEKDANVLMHQRQFHFIYLDPFGCTVHFLDAAFRNIYNNGVLILTSTDLGSLYGKCPQVTLRNYCGNIMKTDYIKELAVRVVLAAAARSAAKCNKGFEVLYSIAVEHFVQVAVRIKRGAQKADATIREVNHICHCQMCDEWCKLPNNNMLDDNPYSMLPCTCNNDHPGKTATKLGPAWCGQIFNSQFVSQMSQLSKRIGLSSHVQSLLSTVSEEANYAAFSRSPAVAEPRTTSDTSATNVNSGKRRAEESEKIVAKKFKGANNGPDTKIPLFYYNLQRRKLKGIDLPKPEKLVAYMNKNGVYASRTHFDAQCIRTSANLRELKDLLSNYHTNTLGGNY